MYVLIIGLLVGVAALAVFLYNRLIRYRNRVDAAWSDIDVQLQRRYDLIPRLVEAVDQYADYERATLEAVTALRVEAQQARSIDERSRAEEQLSDGVRRLLAVAEQYPDLKANENFLELQNELVETENYLQFARRYYNGSVRELNTRIETVPDNVIAGLFAFTQREFFQKSSDAVDRFPRIDLSTDG